MKRNVILQLLCRDFLFRLRDVADKHGIGDCLNNVLRDNIRGKCEATETEVEMLARLCDDERVSRKDIPSMMGKSYRQCNDDCDFDNVKKLRRVGIYSKVSALLLSKESKKDEK